MAMVGEGGGLHWFCQSSEGGTQMLPILGMGHLAKIKKLPQSVIFSEQFLIRANLIATSYPGKSWSYVH